MAGEAVKVTERLQQFLSEPQNKKDGVALSFEFFPPKTEKGVELLKKRLSRFLLQEPLFIDFTWGAGGSTSDLTLELSKMAVEMGFVVNMHLTCTNMPKELVLTALATAKSIGIKNILALRGDPPKGQEKWEVADGGFSCALDLVKFIRSEYGDFFEIGVSGYPEGHPDAIKIVDSKDLDSLSNAERNRVMEMDGQVWVCRDDDFSKELSYLKQKVDAGASFIITQLFYDVDVFFAFVDACRAVGITVPIIPGIMPIGKYAGFKRMTNFCKTRVPKEISEKVEELKEHSEKLESFGVSIVARMCQELKKLGASVLHFYTLNSENLSFQILKQLNLLKPEVTTDAPSI